MGIIGLILILVSLILLVKNNIFPKVDSYDTYPQNMFRIHENIYDTNINIPYGAALKIKEAQDKNLFHHYDVVYSKDSKEVVNKKLIIGLNYNKHNKPFYYLLFSWN